MVNWQQRFEIRYKIVWTDTGKRYYLVDKLDSRFVLNLKFYKSEGQARKAAIMMFKSEQRNIERELLGKG